MTKVRRLYTRVREHCVAFAVLCFIEIGLRLSTLPRLAGWLGIQLDLDSGGRRTNAPALVLPNYAKLCAEVTYKVTRRWPFGDTCLRQCLLLGHRLRGLHPVLRIGVQGDVAAAIKAHSWLEINGCPLDTTASAFTPLGAP